MQAPDQESALGECVTRLKKCYRSRVHRRRAQFPPPTTDTYTDLGLIETQGLLQGELTFPERVRLTVEGRVSDVLKKSNEVELKDLFQLDQEERKVILIEGPPGSGKTTLA